MKKSYVSITVEDVRRVNACMMKQADPLPLSSEDQAFFQRIKSVVNITDFISEHPMFGNKERKHDATQQTNPSPARV